MTSISKTSQPEATTLTLNDLKIAEKAVLKKGSALKIEPLCNNNSTKTMDDFFRSQQLMTPINVEIAIRKHKWKIPPKPDEGCFWPLVFTCPKGTKQTRVGCHAGQVQCIKK
jgi:hypothetical protein